jgi:hypothetical protein
MAKFVFMVIGIFWGAAGLLMLLFPTIWRSAVTGRLRDPGFQFVVMQGIVLAGLVLVMGTTGFRGFGLWVLVGCLGIALASFVLGCATDTRDNLVRSVEQWPLWLYRLGGLMMVSLAVLFGADLILFGS